MGSLNADNSSLATRLKWLRDLSGLRQRGLASLAHNKLTHNFLGKLERDECKSLGADIAIELAKIFGVRVEWLVRGEGPTPRAATVLAAVERARAAASAGANPQAPATTAAAE